MYRNNVFATLTYDDEHLPADGSLNYVHFQLFMKRARKHYGAFRFFMCGEYGETFGRPHYHALFFGLDVTDRVKCNSVFSSSDLYESDTLSRLWGQGFVTLGEVSYESARYCAVYSTKRVVGKRAEEHYSRLNTLTGEIYQIEPEFASMSLRPGIGYSWLATYWKDVYLSGNNGVVVKGRPRPIPRFFDTHMEVIARDVLDEHQYKRLQKAQENCENNTPERLAVREEVTARMQRFFSERKSHAL